MEGGRASVKRKGLGLERQNEQRSSHQVLL